jgi:two-component system, cell cycle sensor histidine kinase and response regulator CckA
MEARAAPYPTPSRGVDVPIVRVPPALREVFAQAEEVVGRFFSERVHDPANGKIEIHGERYLLVRAAALSVEFFDLVRSLYGEERREEAEEFARAILFDLAHAIGGTDEQNFQQLMNVTEPFARISAGPVQFAHAGWASVDVSDESVAKADDDYCLVFDHPYSFEADAWLRAGRLSDWPVCIMSAGYSSGWCEASVDQKLVSAEILCRGKGDEACRFVMAPPHRISAQIDAYIARHPDIAPRAAGFRIPDFFARKRAEESLRKRQSELEHELRQTQKLEALGRLTGGIAHDFNNIISVVLGQAMLARDQLQDNDPLAKDLTRIIEAGERGAALTQRLLAFSRSQIVRTEVLDLNQIVEHMARLIESVIGENIRLSLRLDANAGNVRADRSQLEQVLMNLAVNARDAMPGGGTLTIATTQEHDTKVGLLVRDTGTGMDAATRARIFEPFFTTKGDRGTGLGLSTVYGIVAGAAGTIEVESAPGAGSSFRILLPRESERAGTHERRVQNARPGSGTVLVVEDQPDLREVISESLVAFGYQAILADDCSHALAILTSGSPPIEVLLTDVVMPGIGGVELASRAVALRPGLKVLFMSGYAPDPAHRALFSQQTTGFLQKPFTPKDLANLLTTFLPDTPVR